VGLALLDRCQNGRVLALAVEAHGGPAALLSQVFLHLGEGRVAFTKHIEWGLSLQFGGADRLLALILVFTAACVGVTRDFALRLNQQLSVN